MKKWQISKAKIVDCYLDFSKESYTTLKSVISPFKIFFFFQNYGKLKIKFLRPKKTRSTFLKFELSRLSGQKLKNLEKCSKKAVWAAVDYRYQLSQTTTCLSSEWIKFKPFSGKKREFSHRLLPNARVTKGCQRANHNNKLQRPQRFCVQELDFNGQNNAYECMFHTLASVS